MHDSTFANIADSFASFGFHTNVIGVDPKYLADSNRDRSFVGRHFGPLSEQNTIEVRDRETGLCDFLPRQLQHLGGITTFVFGGRVREKFANVAHGSGSQNRVGDRMQQHVGITVPGQPKVKVRDKDSSDHQRAAGFDSMSIVSDSDSWLHDLLFENSWSTIIRPGKLCPKSGFRVVLRRDVPPIILGSQCRRLVRPIAICHSRSLFPSSALFLRLRWEATQTNMPIIEIKNLCKSYRVYQKREGVMASVKGLFHREYKEVHAVSDISLEVESGEFVAFLGPNGAGKTTTLKLLSGVINPTSGHCSVMGHTPWERKNEYRRKFALVMGQKNQLWWDLPAMESFRLNQHIYGVPAAEFDRTRDELTDMLDVTRLLSQPVRELSLGERMKMELIAALLHKPDVLFLDEPTIGLDVIAQHKIQEFLKHYQEQQKNTILLTSHYMKDIAALCKRVVIIAGGSIYHDGSLEEIVDRFSSDKIVTLQLSEDRSLEGLKDLPNVISVEAPKIKFRVDREDVGKTLSEILSLHAVDDIVVEDPPLEEVISSAFTDAESQQKHDRNRPNETEPAGQTQ